MTLAKEMNRQMTRFAELARQRAQLAAEFGLVAVRGSRELARCNLKLTREMLLGARARVERAVAAESVGAALRAQAELWPATRERLAAGAGSIRATVSTALVDLKRAGLAVVAAPKKHKTAASAKRRRRPTARAAAAR